MIPDYLSPYLVAADAPGMDVINPADDVLVARVKLTSLDDADAAIARADSVRHDWAARTAKDRAAVLRRWHDLIVSNKDALAALCTAECGKPLAESLGEVAYAAGFIEWFAEEGKRAYGETIPTFAVGKRVLTVKQPVGTCAAITPWNFPLAMLTRKVGPALAAGCSIVVKPAEATPLSALALEALAAEAGLPDGLFTVLVTDDPAALGRLFCAHPLIRKLSFTGSTPIGKILIAQAAETVKRVSMELGGNAPFIVFDDADLDAAVEGFMVSKFRNAGQTCVCANRLLVQDGIYDAFLDKLATRIASLSVGRGDMAGTQIGPLINGAAVEKVRALVDDALSQGAKAMVGGAVHNAGPHYYQPTLLSGVTTAMAITSTEIFGPVAAAIRFSDEGEAVRMANATPFGLAAYFYARDLGRVWRVMEALEYGMVGVNEGAISTEVAPFGGIKQSGLGREGSAHGLDEYLEIKYALMGGLSA